MSERLTGTIASFLFSAAKYGGSYGEILVGDGDKHYVWSSMNVYRNGTHPRVGLRVTFNVVDYVYATNISDAERPVS